MPLQNQTSTRNHRTQGVVLVVAAAPPWDPVVDAFATRERRFLAASNVGVAPSFAFSFPAAFGAACYHLRSQRVDDAAWTDDLVEDCCADLRDAVGIGKTEAAVYDG